MTITPDTHDFVIVTDETSGHYGTIAIVVDVKIPDVDVVTVIADATCVVSFPADSLDKPTRDELRRCDSEYLQMMIAAAQQH